MKRLSNKQLQRTGAIYAAFHDDSPAEVLIVGTCSARPIPPLNRGR